MGNISIYNDKDELIGKVDIISNSNVEDSPITRFWRNITSKDTNFIF